MNMFIYEQFIGEVDWKVVAVFVAAFLGMLAARFTIDVIRYCFQQYRSRKEP